MRCGGPDQTFVGRNRLSPNTKAAKGVSTSWNLSRFVRPSKRQATTLKVEMREIGLRMIRQLDWRDFETLVDLIFARGGWQRSSVLGKDQADGDPILTQPPIGETAWAQIKSGTSQAELDEYLGRCGRAGSWDRFFFVCHSAAGALSLPAQPGLHLWAA